MKPSRTAFVSPDEVLAYLAAGWRFVPDETRKGPDGRMYPLMAAPSREPLWFRLRRRLGLAGEVRT